MSYQIHIGTLTEMLGNEYAFSVGGDGGEVIPVSYRSITWETLLSLTFSLEFSPILPSSVSSFPLYPSLCLLFPFHLPPSLSPRFSYPFTFYSSV